MSFLSGFNFREIDGLRLPLGVEKEVWVTDANGRLHPVHWTYFQDLSGKMMCQEDLILVQPGRAGSADKIVPELPATQIELVTGIAANVDELRGSLERLDNRVLLNSRRYNLWPLSTPMPPVEITEAMVEVFPKKRYQKIKQAIPAATLKRAWIAGVHIHLGVSSWEEAITTYNNMLVFMPILMAMSVRDHRRFAQYRDLMDDLDREMFPPYLTSREQFEALAEDHGFHEDPSSCWWLMRLNQQGTVELRFFDAQEQSEHIVQLAAAARALASYASNQYVQPVDPQLLTKKFVDAVYQPELFHDEVESWLQIMALHTHHKGMLAERDAIVDLIKRKNLNLGGVAQLVA